MPFKSPKAIVEAASAAGCGKADMPIAKQAALGFLGGAYIALGGLLAIFVSWGSPELMKVNPGLGKFVFGAVFPVGLMLVVIAGAELFTGNTAVIMPSCLSGAAKWRNLLRNWLVVYIANFVGSVFVALFISYWTGIINVNVASGKALGEAVVKIAEAKVAQNWGQAILRGIGCNWLVCLAIWMAISSDDITGKIVGIWFPIMAFVTLGLEHSIANMYFIPLGMFNGANVSLGQFLFANLLPVTIGNIIGGSGLVGALYWWIYGRD